MRLKFPPTDRERDVAKFLVFEEEAKIVGQSTLRNFELYRVALPGNVHAVRYHADLQEFTSHCNTLSNESRAKMNIKQLTYKGIYLTEYREFVVGQESVGLVQKEVSPNELLESPIFTLDEPVSTLAL